MAKGVHGPLESGIEEPAVEGKVGAASGEARDHGRGAGVRVKEKPAGGHGGTVQQLVERSPRFQSMNAHWEVARGA